MKSSSVILVTIIISGCGKSSENINSILSKWKLLNYKQCELKIKEGIKNLPLDLGININRSDIPRYDAFYSTRPWVVTQNLDVHDYGSDLVEKDKIGQTSVYLNGFTLDGENLLLGKYYENGDHAIYEASIGNFIIEADDYRYDVIKENIATLESQNLTNQNEVSFYNSGGVEYPGNPGILFFGALIDNQSRPFQMNLDGSEKRQVTKTLGYTYGLNISPDGTQYAFHSEYKVYIGYFDSGVETKVETPCKFNFGTIWSPDSSHIVFSCGESNIAPDLYIANRDGTNAHFLASRNGYIGVVPFTSQYDFHGGGSDSIEWTADSNAVILGVNVNSSVELVMFKLDGTRKQLTTTIAQSRNVFPKTSRDGKYLVFHSKRNTNVQNTFMMNLETFEETQITDLEDGCNSRSAIWRNI